MAPMDRMSNEKVRISFICVSLRGGGTERIVTRLANHLCRSASVTITTIAAKNPFYRLNPDIRVDMPEQALRSRSKVIRAAGQVAHLYRALRNQRPNCCLIFGEDIAGVAGPIARFAGVRSVVLFLRGTPRRSLFGFNGLLNPLSARLARFTVVQTEQGKEILSGRYPKGRMRVVPNPVSIPGRVTPLERRERIIVNVGSIGRMKNQSALIRIFARLEGNADWRLILIGDGPDRPGLEHEVRQLGLEDRIEFLGERKDVPAYLDRARIFAFTSLEEGFPNALAEALTAGCACVSYDCPTGPSDLIEHEANGLLIPNDNKTAFEQQLERLVSDETLQARLSRQARKDIERFSEDRVLEQFDQLISETLGHDLHSATEPCDS